MRDRVVEESQEALIELVSIARELDEFTVRMRTELDKLERALAAAHIKEDKEVTPDGEH